MMQAVGLIEVYGLVAAFVAADAACKKANVVIESFDNNKPLNAEALPVPLIIVVKLRGDLENVKIAVDAAVDAANKISGVVSTDIIAKPEEDTEKLLKLNCLK
ncbi:BMC domain-containing protein [Thermoanaerobacterium xylanolyticum]|nr:BMC domain-containing protein [Thermoanaerobacterium xylanolyticum]